MLTKTPINFRVQVHILSSVKQAFSSKFVVIFWMLLRVIYKSSDVSKRSWLMDAPWDYSYSRFVNDWNGARFACNIRASVTEQEDIRFSTNFGPNTISYRTKSCVQWKNILRFNAAKILDLVNVCFAWFFVRHVYGSLENVAVTIVLCVPNITHH